jgi:ATP-dependent Clp protease ATP-binding subunit ClpA
MIPAYLTDGTSTLVQSILKTAFTIAGERSHRTVSPSHVLKALLLAPCRAEQVLRSVLQGNAYGNLEKIVDATIEPGTASIDFPKSVSPKVDSIFKRARLLAKNLGAAKVESLHVLLSFLLEDDCNPQVLLTQAGITTSLIIVETSKTILPGGGDSQSDGRVADVESEFPRLVALLSTGGVQPSLLPEFIHLCEKDGTWRGEFLRLFHLFAAAQASLPK